MICKCWIPKAAKDSNSKGRNNHSSRYLSNHSNHSNSSLASKDRNSSKRPNNNQHRNRPRM